MKQFSVLLIPALIFCAPLYSMNFVIDHAQGAQGIHDIHDTNPHGHTEEPKIAKEIVPSLKQVIATRKPNLSEAEQAVLLMQLVTRMLASTHITAKPH